MSRLLSCVYPILGSASLWNRLGVKEDLPVRPWRGLGEVF